LSANYYAHAHALEEGQEESVPEPLIDTSIAKQNKREFVRSFVRGITYDIREMLGQYFLDQSMIDRAPNKRGEAFLFSASGQRADIIFNNRVSSSGKEGRGTKRGKRKKKNSKKKLKKIQMHKT